MAEPASDPVRESLEPFVGKPMGPPIVAPDPVNVPMIRHWVDALDDRNPVYLDEAAAKQSRFGGLVAPPAMLQAWTMARPKVEGIAERGGAPMEIRQDNPISALNAAGFTGTLATNSSGSCAICGRATSCTRRTRSTRSRRRRPPGSVRATS
jgi:hypothetical protein